MDIGTLAVIMLVGGFLAGLIASSKGRSFGGYFVFGALFPLIGVIVALAQSPDKLAKMETPGTEGWHPDPTGRFDQRYHDGRRWTKWVMRGDQRLEDVL